MDHTQPAADTATAAAPPDIVSTAATRLAPLLMRRGLNVSVGRDGIIEVRNPKGTRMRQEITIIEHEGAPHWAWVWSGATRGDAPELEVMVPTDHTEEAARRLERVLAVIDA